jgi:site-specific DNA recombinase
MKRNRIRVVIYVRVSSKEQVDGYSIGEQIERLEKYADAMEWDIVKTFVDPGYSGGNTDRPGLKEMIKEIEKGGIDKVVVYKLDRLSRSQLDTLYLIEKVFLANNTDFVSMSENFDTSTPFGRAMIGILAVFAQLEREQIRERMTMGKEARAKEGKWHGSKYVPLGYEYNESTDLLEVNDYEAMQVRELFDTFLTGVPLRSIETAFFEKGYTHKHGVWDSKAMRRVLKNKVYLGYLRHKDNYYKAEHTPIISEETYERAQELLKQREEQYKEFYRKPGARTTYLGGMLYCKHCGAKYAKQLGGSSKYGKLYYYCCYSRSKKVKKMIKDPSCMNKYWRMEVLDEIVLNEIKKLAIDPEYINTLKNETPVESETPDKIKIIQDEIASIDVQISRFMDLYGIGKFTIDQVSQKIDPLNEKRSALEKELNKLNFERGAITEERAIEIINSFEDILERGNFDEIRLVIESLIYYIELDNDDVYIHWKFA